MGAAVVLLVALVAGLLVSIRSAPPVAPKPASAGPSFGDRITELIRQAAKEIADAVRRDPPPKSLPKPKPAPPAAVAKVPSTAAKPVVPVPASTPKLPAGRTWHYRVVVQPPVWREATLTYRTVEQVKGIAVYTEFRHAGGKSNFQLGLFAPGDASHANTRFPGFFLYAAYLNPALKVGDPVAFGWHWQGKSPASTKRFSGNVTSVTDEVVTPAGRLRAVKVSGTWTYLEDGQFRARAHEEVWYAPGVSQIVRIERTGIAPDEASARIVAELVEFK